jgi:hypothetical protein
VTPDASDEEAAWRELVAQYAAPAVAEGVPAPWPTREDLPGVAADDRGGADLDAERPDAEGPDTADLGAADLDGAGLDTPDTASGDAPEAGAPEGGDAPPGPGASSVPGVIPAPPQLRIIRPASPAPLPDGDDDERFVPPVPPPLPRLDPLTKGAWVALFGGPAYLLIAVMVDWQVPGWAAFCAVAAFVGGFATLVVHMGERPPRDSGPDDGAVV